jgi:hypothetical protein
MKRSGIIPMYIGLLLSISNCTFLQRRFGFLYPDKQMDGSFVKCCPKNNDRQIVFTHARPFPVIGIKKTQTEQSLSSLHVNRRTERLLANASLVWRTGYDHYKIAS